MSVEARKSSPAPAVIIRPPEALTVTTTTSGGTIKLTSFDRGFVKVPFTVLLVFEHMDHHAIDSIKRALSQALVHYYPFAGRIIISSEAVDGDEFSIRCTSDGVEFLTASMDCSLKEAKILHESPMGKINPLLNELAVLYPAGSYGFDDPLLSVQVTEFSCGGLVLAVTSNHAIADGVGIAQFLSTVGELARGSPSPSVVPVRWDDAVSRHEPWPNPIVQAMLACPESQGMEFIAPLDITIPSALINRVKAEYLSGGFDEGQAPCTVFEVVIAVLWRCHIRATMSNKNPLNPVYLSFATDMRKYVGAKDGYYGNCSADRLLSVPTRSAAAEATILDLIRMIKRAKDQLPDTVKKGNHDQLMMQQGLHDRYDMMHVTTWRNVGFEHVDFGGGAPARVMFHGREGGTPPVPICIMYPPCKGMDGVNLLLLSVKEEHVDAFLGELAKHT
ncbi:hypothetical protein HU200_016484 [Digitaria exilis]|uniref:Uncharacterized protein n=1 Tax=Digitaria exilis TaxID=1010633 RepID=A0A835F8T3_9POAL|nr:hypothetical protein HU200_016484 [Digitaria exilis]CAB3455496.1 unnamed protein product [Digitaria exilis]